MPLDPEPVSDGNVFIISQDADGTPRVAVAQTAADVPNKVAPDERYQAHFVTCPDAGAWRKSRKPKQR